jgi:outer membrane protein assembly factor BamA
VSGQGGFDCVDVRGYGGKAFLLNFLGWNESLDMLAFQSTKGERWYRVAVSVPDFEVRQGTLYPLAVDLLVDYDRWVAYNFFGIGSGSHLEDRQVFTREPLEVSLLFSRGFSETLVAQAGVRGRRIANEGLRPTASTPGSEASSGTVSTLGIILSCRYDSRDSYIAPSRGTVAQLECEVAPQVLRGSVRYIRWAVWFTHFVPVEVFRSVVAFRAGMEALGGEELPMQVLVSLGGGSTLRGSEIGRFVDRAGALANCEWRIPLFWRFGAILGCDAGKVWGSPGRFDFHSWAFNPVTGLRFSMETFVVRADVGFGTESTGFFLNFGHLF